jgi:O-antigen ligase/cytochrome c-type biogenesis protein CcmH/NrfG
MNRRIPPTRKHVPEDTAVRNSADKATGGRGCFAVQMILLCAAVFISPLIAGKLTPIPALSVQILVLLAALFWIIRSAAQGTIVLPGRWVFGSLTAFFLLLVISAWHSASLYLTIRGLLDFTAYLLVFLMVVGLGSDRRSVYLILASLMVSALIVGALGVREYALAGSAGWRVFSTFFNPDFLAGFAAMMLPIALAWYLSRTSLGISAVAGLAVLYLFANVLISGSRFGALTALGGVIVFLVLALVSVSVRRPQVLRGLVLVIPLVLVYLLLSRPLAGRIAATKAESHSGGFRIYTWKGTLRMAEANPLHGTGLGTFEIAYPRYALVGYTKLAHNTYLQLAAEAGPLAAGMLVVLLMSSALPPMIALARGRVKSDSTDGNPGDFRWMPDSSLMTCGLLGGAAASMARNLVDSDWYVTAIGISFWAVLGAAVAMGNPGRGTGSRMSRVGSYVFGLLTVIAISLAGVVLAAEVVADRGDAMWNRNPESTIADYRLALKLDPLNAECHRHLASAYRALARQSADESLIKNARRELSAAIRLEPGNAKTYYQLGRFDEFYPNNENSIRAYRAALERNPNAPEVMLALARAYEVAGRHEEAVGVWERMIALEDSPYERIRAVPELVAPEYIFAHQALGREYERNGDKAAAVREYNRALDRIVRYQDSVKAMREILEANERRDLQMEQSVEDVRLDLNHRLSALTASK